MDKLQKFVQVHSSCQPLVQEIKDFYNKNGKLLELYKLPNFNGELLLEVYEFFIKHFEEKMNALTLSKLILNITNRIKDQKMADEFLSKVIERIEKNQKEVIFGTIVLRIEKAMCRMRNSPKFDEEKIKEILEESKKLIVEKGYVDPFVNAYYYKTKAKFEQKTDMFNEFYKSALLFLSYTSIEEELTKKDQEFWAFQIGLAALIGDEIYNFGELLANPVFQVLKISNENNWLYQMLIVYNRGDIKGYVSVEQKFSEKLNKQLVLKANKNFLERKIQLMAILELVFSRDVGNRVISFKEIADVSRCKLENVELVLMKALSIGLIKGIIDQVEKSIYVSWCQPRVLDSTQIEKLRNKMQKWYENVMVTQKNLKE